MGENVLFTTRAWRNKVSNNSMSLEFGRCFGVVCWGVEYTPRFAEFGGNKETGSEKCDVAIVVWKCDRRNSSMFVKGNVPI